jgi:CDP-glycerol glycerophosphotransferase (TagB/SpsB family)
VLYAPTGEKYNSLEAFGERVIELLANTARFNVLVKLHDHPKDTKVDWPQRLARFEGPCVRIVKSADVIPMLFLANLLITDASSVSNEFSLLDRPMIFLDVPKLLEVARNRKGAMVDLDTWGRRGGELVTAPEDLLPAVEVSLNSPILYGDIRREMAADLFFNPGGATQAAAAWLREYHSHST